MLVNKYYYDSDSDSDSDSFISPLNQQINIQNDGKINKIIQKLKRE